MAKGSYGITKVFSPQAAIDNYEAMLDRQGHLTSTVKGAIDNARAVRGGHATVLYIAGGLTGMDDDTKHRYVQVSELVATKKGMFGYAPHLHGTDPVLQPDVTPQEVRDIDYLWAAIVPDYHINFWHPVAHGNAVEAGWAEVNGIPSIHLVPEGVALSRLVRGMNNIVSTITYAEFVTGGLPQLDRLLDSLNEPPD